MAEKKKTIDDVIDKSVDDIIAYFQSHTGEDFKTRIKKFEEFHNEKHGIASKLSQHAEYVVRGKPSDRDKFPGAYEVAYKKLDDLVKKDTGKLDEKQATSVIEAYVDSFLKAVHSDFDEMMKHAKAEGLSEEEIREMKGQLFAQYHTSQEGTINPLDAQFIKKNVVGKTKIKTIDMLRGLAQTSQEHYTSRLQSRATTNLLKEEDRLAFAKYIKPKLDKAGFEHDDHPLQKTVQQLGTEYTTLLRGGDMSKHGYRHVEKEEKGKA